MTRTDQMLILYSSLLPARLAEAERLIERDGPDPRSTIIDDARTKAWSDAGTSLHAFEHMQKLAK